MSTMQPKFSLTIIAYNEEEYIGECLESIANQTTMPDEVIVVDNNSTDRTAEIIKSFKFAKYVFEPEQGMAHARNRGFKESKYPLIARIDADTHLPPNWTKQVHEIMDSHANEICAASGPTTIYDLPTEAAQKLMGEIMVKLAYFKISKLALGHETVFGSNLILTRKTWDKVKNELCQNDNEIHEDLDLAIHVARYGKIYYDERLEASVGKRVFTASPKKILWKIRAWPKTIFQHEDVYERFHPLKQHAVKKTKKTRTKNNL